MVKKIAVIFGGQSNENEISVITGTMALNVLKSAGYETVPVYIAQNGDIYTGEKLADISNFSSSDYVNCPQAMFFTGGIYELNKRGKPKKFIPFDVALNCCHGGSGEGGGISGLCEVLNIPFASAGVFESSALMDKYLTKLVLSAIGVETARYVYVKSVEEAETADNMPDFPLIVKPVSLGSSIGVEKVATREELRAALECALLYDRAVIIEEYFSDRREINCAAYYSAGKVVTSDCEEARPGGDIFSYEEKYGGHGKSVYPADIPEQLSEEIKKITRVVYEKLNMRGIVRFDFILSGGKVYLSEINTVPGSLSYYLLADGFKDFARVLNSVIDQAVADFSLTKSKKLIRTGILENISTNACKVGRK